MEESGSEGLDEFIFAEVKKGKGSWFDGVDAVCIVGTPPFFLTAPSYYVSLVR